MKNKKRCMMFLLTLMMLVSALFSNNAVIAAESNDSSGETDGFLYTLTKVLNEEKTEETVTIELREKNTFTIQEVILPDNTVINYTGLPVSYTATENGENKFRVKYLQEGVNESNMENEPASPVIKEDTVPFTVSDIQEKKLEAKINIPKVTSKIVSLTSPLLTIDKAGGELETTTANRSKGYQAQFSVRAADTSVGVPTVWLGYRFTLEVPVGYSKEDIMFDANTHIWLRDSTDIDKVAIANYDTKTRTWILEGKYLYNDPSKPLGSGAAYTYSTGIAVKTGWVRDDAQITPTMQSWLIDDTTIDTGVGIGETTTVKNTPILRSGMTNLNETTSGYYDAGTGKFYYTKAEAISAGATNVIHGRVFSFAGYATTEPTVANEKLEAGQEVTVRIPLNVKTSTGDINDPAMQPILLGAHYDSYSHKDTNDYAGGLQGDLTFGGRDPGTTDTSQWNETNIPGSIKSVTFQNGVVTAVLVPTNEQQSVTYYMVAFVPGDANDTPDTKRTLVVGENPYTTTPTPSGVDYTLVDWNVVREILVKPMESDAEAFIGAYSRSIEYDNRTAALFMNAKNQYGWLWIQNVKTAPAVEIKAFDALVKVDADYMTLDTSKPTVRIGGSGNAVGLASYPVKYGVLPGGENWASEADMSSLKKDALTFYEAGTVPAGNKVVALLVEARGGTQGGIGNTVLGFGFDVTNDDALVQTVGQMTMDVDIWATGMNPNTDEPIKMHADDHGGYKKDTYDTHGNRSEDPNTAHLSGDSFLVVGYETMVKSENLNGDNRPIGNAGTYTSSFDVTAGNRTMDIKDTVIFEYKGKPEDDSNDKTFKFRVKYPISEAPGMVVQPDSIQLNATYTPGTNPGDAGIIQGGKMPDKVEVALDGREIWAYFTVKGSGAHEIYASVTLGDALNPDKDLTMGTKNYIPVIEPIEETTLLSPVWKQSWHHASIVKSTVAGFVKTTHSKVAVLNGEVGYRLSLSAQNRNLTGALCLDVLPFNGDGRGTTMSGNYTIDKPITMTVTTSNSPMLSDSDIYYTTDTAIQTNPLKTVDDIKGLTFYDGVTHLGVTWKLASKTLNGTVYSYDVEPNTTAIVITGTIGSQESPAVDLYLQTKNMSPDDTLANNAGFTADGIGDSMLSQGGTTTMANRFIEGSAWLDLNRNGQRDDSEAKLSGLTVKLFCGGAEVTKDASGNMYSVVTDTNGNYKFHNVPSSPEKYHVEFSGTNIGKYTTTEKTKAGVPVDINSDVFQNPSTGIMTSAVSDEVNLLTLEQQNATNTPVDMKQLDAGFVPIYTVVYKTDGGVPVPSNEEKLHGDKVTEPTAPTKEGFAFGGWYYDKNGAQTKWDFASDIVTSDLILTAKWTDKEYTVIYNTDGGNSIDNKTGVKFGDDNLLPANPIKAGFTFDGWTYAGTNVTDTTKYSDLATNDTVLNVTLDAQWTAKEYRVKYNTKGADTGAIADKTNVLFTDADLLPIPNPIKAGFVFNGWTHVGTDVTSATKYCDLVVDDMVTEITLEAQWSAKAYTVKYDTNGGNIINDKTGLNFSDKNLLPNDPIKAGYTFNGWKFDNKDITADTTYNSLVANDTVMDVTLVAHWKAKEYTVKYDTQGAGMIADKTGVLFKDGALLPTNPTKDGYTFQGWKYQNMDVTDVTTYNSLVSNDAVMSITLVAQWKENIYKVKYETGFEDVVVSDKENVKWNDANLLPIPPKKDGYGFTGWEFNGKQVLATDKYSELTTDQTDGTFITLLAKWVELTDYSVLYNTNGGSMPNDTPSTLTGMKYTDIVPTPIPEREGYTFKGWTYLETDVKENSSYHSLAKDDTLKQIELVAQWEINTYTIVYEFVSDKSPEGITVPKDVTVEFGSTINEPKFTASKNWTFHGWYRDKECTQKYDFNTAITHDKILYGNWTYTEPVEPSPEKPTKPETKPSDAPKTGDTTDIGLILLLMTLSSGLLLIIALKYKKQRDM